MFNPKGSDSGREWFEVCNGSDTEISLENFSFKESDSSHKLNLIQGSDRIVPDTCFIVASDDKLFKNDYPNYSGTLYDSYFFLSNSSGEKIEIFLNGTLQDSIVYPTESVQEGYSVSKNGNSFLLSNPSPGDISFVNPGSEELLTPENSVDKGETVSSIAEIPIYKFKTVEIEPPQDIFVRLPGSLRAHAHEIVNLPVELFDARGKSIKQAQVSISWGDFKNDNSNMSKTFQHIYKLPGRYIVKVEAKLSALQAQAVLVVDVEKLQLEFFWDDKNKIFLFRNLSDTNLNLYKWRIYSRGRIFVLPEALIMANSELRVSLDDISSYSYLHGDPSLVSPDGKFKIYAEKISDKEPNEEERHTHKNKAEYLLQNDHDKPDNENLKGIDANNINKEKKMDSPIHKKTNIKHLNLNTQENIFGMRVKSANNNYKKAFNNKDETRGKFGNYELGITHRSKQRQLAQATGSFMEGEKIWLAFLFFVPALVAFVYIWHLLKKDEFDDWEFEE